MFESKRYMNTPNGKAMLKFAIENTKAVVIGAGAGLSTSAGYVYNGERFDKYFGDFGAKYGYDNMYAGGFCHYEKPEIKWAFWSRYIWINRYMKMPKPVYEDLFSLVKDKEYFVLTTNVDHCFQRAGFDKERIFYTQGDYGLWQCSKPCHKATYDNEEIVREMVLSQGFRIADDGELILPMKEDGTTDFSLLKMEVPTELGPVCPVCGRPMEMNLRSDSTFVEDEGWFDASRRFDDFVEAHKNEDILFLELGVGYNTPGIIKYNFWKLTAILPRAVFACVNYGAPYAPAQIKNKAICIDGDCGKVIGEIKDIKFE